LQFEWDPEQAALNLAEHGISFEEAATAFGDALSRTIADPDHSDDEQRFVLLGLTLSWSLGGCFAHRPRRDRSSDQCAACHLSRTSIL
jgi:uncharacterized DUF497 family protein